MLLTKWTFAVCADCGFIVVGAHDCQRQRELNPNDPPLDNFGRQIFLIGRGELIARLARK